MSQLMPESGSGCNIVYLNHTHSGMMWGVTESSAAPLSQPGNMWWIQEQYPLGKPLKPALPQPRLRAAENEAFKASLDRSLHEHADVWAELAKR
jgi:hypothetical protein